jgi:hypothetical protein
MLPSFTILWCPLSSQMCPREVWYTVIRVSMQSVLNVRVNCRISADDWWFYSVPPGKHYVSPCITVRSSPF